MLLLAPVVLLYSIILWGNYMTEMKIYAKSIPYGIMVWWDKCEEAACYNVRLYVSNPRHPNGYQELDTVTVARTTFYHTFTGLADQNYIIDVSAEDREGETVECGAIEVDVRSIIGVYNM